MCDALLTRIASKVPTGKEFIFFMIKKQKMSQGVMYFIQEPKSRSGYQEAYNVSCLGVDHPGDAIYVSLSPMLLDLVAFRFKP